jgi:uncharacterized membrane protein YeaQ/YmgE (transglycosylase-associated protein family)
MSFLIFLLVGLIAGILAKAIMPGSADEPSGWVLTIVLGVVGAFVGGFVGNLFGIGTGNFIGEVLMATVGAIIVIAIMRAFSHRTPVAR